jgi:hypothetical protein
VFTFASVLPCSFVVCFFGFGFLSGILAPRPAHIAGFASTAVQFECQRAGLRARDSTYSFYGTCCAADLEGVAGWVLSF